MSKCIKYALNYLQLKLTDLHFFFHFGVSIQEIFCTIKSSSSQLTANLGVQQFYSLFQMTFPYQFQNSVMTSLFAQIFLEIKIQMYQIYTTFHKFFANVPC